MLRTIFAQRKRCSRSHCLCCSTGGARFGGRPFNLLYCRIWECGQVRGHQRTAILSLSRNLLADCGVAKELSNRFGKGTGTPVASRAQAACVLWGMGPMFQTFLKKRAANRAYQRTVDDCLTVLFCGFPNSLLPSLRKRVGNSGLVRRGQAEGTDARACSVQVAVLLVRKIIGHLSKQERQGLAQAFLQDDASNPTYKGFKYMFQVVEQLNVSPAFVSYLNAEVAGQLRGMSQQAIFNSWVEARIGRVIDQLRERCLEEAERKRELWQ